MANIDIPEVTRKEDNRVGVASLVLGIISVVIAVLFAGFGWLAALLGLVGIVLGSSARKQGQGGAATAGFVLSIIGLVLGLLMYVACAAMVGGLASLA